MASFKGPSSGPISLASFSKALIRTWATVHTKKAPNEFRAGIVHDGVIQELRYLTYLGLAISGGVDSMALALLCSRLRHYEPSKLSCVALIVDHKAREGSTAEAERTCKRLRNLGLATLTDEI